MTQKERLQSLHVAMSLLETIAGGNAGFGVSELSEELGLSRPRVHRVLATLHDRGYLTKNGSSKYVIGPKVFELGFDYLRAGDLQKVAMPVLEEIAAEAQETAHLAVFNQGAALYIGRAESAKPWALSSRIGIQSPIHCTAIGKVLLAHQSENTIEAIVSNGLERLTDNTICDAATLQRELACIREQGYALDMGESYPDLRCVAAPVWDYSERVVAGIGISAHASRLTPERIGSLIPFVKQMASKVSAQLGYRERTPAEAVSA